MSGKKEGQVKDFFRKTAELLKSNRQKRENAWVNTLNALTAVNRELRDRLKSLVRQDKKRITKLEKQSKRLKRQLDAIAETL